MLFNRAGLLALQFTNKQSDETQQKNVHEISSDKRKTKKNELNSFFVVVPM